MNLLGAPTVEFCEKATSFIIKRPFYALSNIVYLFVGVLILNKKTRFSKVFGYTSLFIGLASFVYDASYTYVSQLVDLFAMLVFVNILISLNIKRIFGFSNKFLTFLGVVFISFGISVIIYFKSFSGEFVFGIFVITVVLTELFLWKSGKSKNIKTFLFGFLVFTLGFVVWLPDAMGLLCDPNNIVNGRSLFHVLTSITVYVLYKYYELQEYRY
jgi:hypothetical protein